MRAGRIGATQAVQRSPQALALIRVAADKRGMPSASGPTISPAYSQIVNWYQNFQKVQGSTAVPLLITHGAPDEAADQPKQTDPSTPTIDIIA